MKTWNFNSKSNPKLIGQKLKAAFGSGSGFVFKMDPGTNDSVTFKVHKSMAAYGYGVLNDIRVNGKLSKTGHKNETKLEISFANHFLTPVHLAIVFVLGLSAIIVGIIHNSNMYLYGGLIFVVGIASWFNVRRKSAKDIEKYKTLISGIIEE
ncbi:DUF423 domain-containing protein [Mangrovibacterium diazotrophicum]|uniref:Uncharacterized protein n=1 Tax=Mangrovibacterium diazotrophicum TaxID=1261403 RepID=A0A419W859_9BACT|nr:DUF423 domain-containing protein [Mangrovibacterium diazotrophicum]RKD91657.1 hypothetical protein BC643_2019 [Mangrovibacterium diazotrophicum]